MLPGMNPKKMAAMMKQLGIKQEEVDALRVVIDKVDGGRIVIENPEVMKVNMQGQETWQISGESVEEEVEVEISDGDINLVVEKTGKSEGEVRKVLEEVDGDIAEAIVKLS
ncbi:MAG: nascent polypeptide-associated complex protein [Candidatus Pacearchaeota archaeon]|nr:nascent polypeptide-associated complex protein [Candidatus Pacearchaeota archaeon]